MPFEIRPHPAFSWSHSRDNTFWECARRYYLRYYGGHNGWLAPPGDEGEARLAYVLKHLVTLHTVAGTAIHDCARDSVLSVRAGESPLSLPQMTRRVHGTLHHVCRCSKDRDAFLRDPKRNPMVHSIYYRERWDEGEVEMVRDKVERCLGNLAASGIWAELAGYAPEEIVVVDKLDTVTVDGVTLYAAPDLVLHSGEQVTVLDWKTGTGEEVVLPQLSLYAFYVERKLGLRFKPGCWMGRVVRLYEGTDESLEIRRTDLIKAEGRMRTSIDAMRGYLEDPEKNRPMPRDAFPLAHRALRWRCPYCPFFEMCTEHLGKRGVASRSTKG